MSILRNVTVSWANVQAPNVQFEPCWEILAHLSQEQANELMAEAKKVSPKGIKIKKDDNGNLSYRFRRRVERADGNGENAKPAVLDALKQPISDLIGNGSVCNIQYLFSGYDNKFGKGVTCDLKGVQVLELVAYGVQDGDEFDSEESSSSTPAKEVDNSYDDGDFS